MPTFFINNYVWLLVVFLYKVKQFQQKVTEKFVKKSQKYEKNVKKVIFLKMKTIKNMVLEKNIIFVLNYFQGSCSRIPPSFKKSSFWCFICIIWDEKNVIALGFFSFCSKNVDIFVDFIFIFAHFFEQKLISFWTPKRDQNGPSNLLRSKRGLAPELHIGALQVGGAAPSLYAAT